MLKDFYDLRISDLIIILIVEVHFINCTAGGENKEFGRHCSGQCKKQTLHL